MHRTRYNSAQLVGPDGKPAGRYSKIHRVPFGEYIPLKGTFMDRLAPYKFDYSIAAGESQPRLPLGKYRFGVIICYEDTDHRLAVPTSIPRVIVLPRPRWLRPAFPPTNDLEC